MARNEAVLRALCGKLNLGVLCVAVGAAAFLESSALLVVGMATFVGLVAREAHATGRRLQFVSIRIPDGSTFKNMAICSAIDGINAAQKERLEALAACPDEIVGMLDDLLRSAGALEVAALRLARRTDRMHGYLSRKDLVGARDILYSAQQAAQLARSPHEREIYAAAARSHAIHVETLGGLELGVRVALAKLEHIRATLSVVAPRIVKLSAASADLADTSAMRLAEDLHAASAELQEAEERFQMLALSGPEDPCPDAGAPAPVTRGVRVAAATTDPGEDGSELDEPPLAAHRGHLAV